MQLGQDRTRLGKNGVLILDPVCLINDDVAPVELLEVVLLLDHHLIRCYNHIKLSRHQVLLLGGLRQQGPL